MTNGANAAPAAQPAGNRRVIPTTCSLHGGTPGFTNLVVSKRDGAIVMDPHATGACVLRLDKDAASVLRDLLTEWLG
ncbi:MAG: hypothetical protein M3460_10530 [Actinomycetota bacterium]|nr:hypothetical protein [Actinomycetota bacterium]